VKIHFSLAFKKTKSKANWVKIKYSVYTLKMKVGKKAGSECETTYKIVLTGLKAGTPLAVLE